MPRIVSPIGKVRSVTDAQATAFLMTRRGWTYHPADAPPEPAPADDGPPAVNDPKADWVAYAESQGIDTDGMSKADVIESVGG